MNKFIMKIFKWSVPLGLIALQTKIISNKQPSSNGDQFTKDYEQIKHTLQQHDKFIKSIEQINKQQQQNRAKQQLSQIKEGSDGQQKESQSEQKVSEQSQNNQSNKQIQEQPNKQKQSEQKINVFEQIGKQQQQQQSQITKTKNVAKVSQNTPQYIIDYLRLFNMKIVVDQKMQTNTIQIKNKVGDSSCISIQVEDQYSLSPITQIANFANPPRIIRQKQQIKGLFKNLPNDEYIIAVYIPSQNQYTASKIPKSDYDTFTNANTLQIAKIQQQFRKLKYESVSNKYSYYIVRDPEVARQMKINPNKIGDRYVFYKTTPNQGMETSSLLQGEKFTIKTVPRAQIDSQKNIIKTGLYSLINQINYDGDMRMFVKGLQVKKQKRKVLLIYSRQKRPQFVKQLKSILLKVAKMMKQDVLVVLTQNQKLLPKYFQIVPDKFVTIRLLDISKSQPPLISIAGLNDQARNFYSRTVMSGPFTVQNVCRFIKDKKWKQYYESKKNLTTIQSIVSQSEQMPNNTVILHWKHGCKGCQLTLDYLQRIKSILSQWSPQTSYQYQIQNPKLVKHIHFRRFNILNQQYQKNGRDHDTTPKLKLYKNGKMIDLNISEMISKLTAVNASNQQQIHNNIIKQIIAAIDRTVGQTDQHI